MAQDTRIGVVRFPGSPDDRVAERAVRLAGAEPVPLWHAAHDLDGVDALVLVGCPPLDDGAGADPASSPLLAAVADAAGRGLPVLGAGDGFRLLCATGLLPGALAPNEGGSFVCRDQRLRVETRDTVWTCTLAEGREVILPVRSAHGRWVAEPDVVARVEAGRQVVLRYLGNPNGSLNDIAGITSAGGNVVGLLPSPAHAAEALTGPSDDGLLFLSAAMGFVAISR